MPPCGICQGASASVGRLRIAVDRAAADEHLALGVEHGNTRAIAVGHGLAIGRHHVPFFISALTGTMVKPRSEAVLHHSASVCTETGRAEISPIAAPLPSAFCSSDLS